MHSNKRIIACLLVCSLAASAVGCTSMKTIHPVTDPATATFGSVKVGDTVVVQTRDGRRARFTIQQIDSDAIVSQDGVRYARGEITRLQRRSFSVWKTALLIGGLSAGAFVVLAAALVSKFPDP